MLLLMVMVTGLRPGNNCNNAAETAVSVPLQLGRGDDGNGDDNADHMVCSLMVDLELELE